MLFSAFCGVIAAVAFLTLKEVSKEPTEGALLSEVYAQVPTTGPVSYADAVSRAVPAVVNIHTTKITRRQTSLIFDDPFFRQFFGEMFNGGNRTSRETNLGSGVIADSRGFIVTNYHVIAGASEIKVGLADGSNLDAKVVGSDLDTDIAVLYVDRKELPVMPVGNSADLRVGDVVLAIGNPFGVGQTVTMGIVSATGRNQLGISNFENFIQTDASINPGNSGGALVDAHGRLIGINTAIFSKSGGSQGIGFAIPVDMVRGIMDQLIEDGEVSRGWLGISGQDVTEALAESLGLIEVRGVLISDVYKEGPSYDAGLRPGDVITELDGQAIDSAFDVVNAISTKRPGTRVDVKGWRGSKPLYMEIVLDKRPVAGEERR